MQVYWNGALVDESAVRISFDDRGFLFGDGVYEVVRVYHHQFFEWSRHMARLERSLRGIALPGVDLAAITQGADRLLEQFPEADGALYLEITRGAYPRAHAFPPDGTKPTVLMWIRPVPARNMDAWHDGVSVMTTYDDRWAKVWIKTIGLLPNVLAKEQAHRQGLFDAIFVRDGMVTEATSSNVFIAQNGQLMTAPVTNYILPGITREVLLEEAQRLQLPVVQQPFSVEALKAADEVFLTGTTTEVLPVTKVDGHLIGTGQAGPIARMLLDALWSRAGVVS
ncbi:aminotransferase class IV [Sulfobacillus sp. hq2]|uniref:aminotransferase class IV n=1 Tax=Sulfobacillus TaxID=28033 RepID=UPI000CD0008A|nr:aminotransferase class IV [Sulfobacillus sp. hq2]POB09294.1 amino acid aminotransferase [Sulfobacillus sp. hq2]